jgi:hypothetical protein
MARPPIEIDEVQLEKLAQLHCTNTEIAAFFNCSVDTITRRYADLLDKGREAGKIALRRKQWQLAIEKGDRVMLIWLGKQYLGQSEKVAYESDNVPWIIESELTNTRLSITTKPKELAVPEDNG